VDIVEKMFAPRDTNLEIVGKDRPEQ
jgi:hypothetical protein